MYTSISWAYYSWNPWWGCVHVSPACDHCYAEIMANRRMHEFVKIFPPEVEFWGKDSVRAIEPDHVWDYPIAWNATAAKKRKQRAVFCGSMCDVMEDREDLIEPRKRLYSLVERTPHLIWQFLSKRPQNYQKFLPESWIRKPRQNVWLMTTVENSDYLWRIDEILKVPAAAHGISAEPLLSPIQLPESFLNLKSKAWVIVGGESGRSKEIRATHTDWFRGLRDQCISADVPFFFKQWGKYNQGLIQIDKSEDDILDGLEWKQFPAGYVNPKEPSSRG